MADGKQLSALAAFLEKLPPSQAGDFAGKLARVWLSGDAKMHQCIVLDYDAVGIHVKDTSLLGSGGPETQFYLWHRVDRVES